MKVKVAQSCLILRNPMDYTYTYTIHIYYTICILYI